MITQKLIDKNRQNVTEVIPNTFLNIEEEDMDDRSLTLSGLIGNLSNYLKSCGDGSLIAMEESGGVSLFIFRKESDKEVSVRLQTQLKEYDRLKGIFSE